MRKLLACVPRKSRKANLRPPSPQLPYPFLGDGDVRRRSALPRTRKVCCRLCSQGYSLSRLNLLEDILKVCHRDTATSFLLRCPCKEVAVWTRKSQPCAPIMLRFLVELAYVQRVPTRHVLRYDPRRGYQIYDCFFLANNSHSQERAFRQSENDTCHR